MSGTTPRISHGQALLRRLLVGLIQREPIENHRPDWLGGLELDLFWPDLGFAAEFQGDQHYVPSFGLQSHIRQRMNDREKKSVCSEHKIMLIRVRAVDLEYTRLRGMIRTSFRTMVDPGKSDWRRFNAIMGRSDVDLLRRLNKEAIAYRATLIERFNSPTASRRGRLRKEAMRVAWQPFGGNRPVA
jgi:hypothetical protein